jgi:hypothetical protein
MPELNVQSRAMRLVIATIVGVVAALAVPYGNLWLKCQVPTSEACVWSKEYLPLSLGLTAVILGVPVFIVTLILLRRYATVRSR